MSKLLEEAIAKLAELSEADQDSIAMWLLEELDSERNWERLFSESHDNLAHLADKTLSEHRRGRTEELNPGDL